MSVVLGIRDQVAGKGGQSISKASIDWLHPSLSKAQQVLAARILRPLCLRKSLLGKFLLGASSQDSGLNLPSFGVFHFQVTSRIRTLEAQQQPQPYV